LSLLHGTITAPQPRDVALFSTFGLELFYDVMLTTNKYWILQRLSFFIGIVMYGVYFIIVHVKIGNGDYAGQEFDAQEVIAVLSVRLAAFIFEEAVDVAIDCAIHNELVRLQRERDRLANGPKGCCACCAVCCAAIGQCCCFKLVTYLGSTDVSLPSNVTYKGSLFAWGPTSVFNEHAFDDGLDPIPEIWFWIFCAIPLIPTVILLVLLALLCGTAFLLLLIVLAPVLMCLRCYYGTSDYRRIRQRITSTGLWKELRHHL